MEGRPEDIKWSEEELAALDEYWYQKELERQQERKQEQQNDNL